MAHKTTQVLALLELLQAHGQLNGAELAQRLDLDRRTLRRYIVSLEQLGIPILTERGRYGGYTLMPGYKLTPMMFNDDEVLALTLGLLAAKHLGLNSSKPSIATVYTKLERIVPDKLKQQMRAISETVEMDLNAIAQSSNEMPLENNRLLEICSTATLKQQSLYMRYCSIDGNESERQLDPFSVVFYLGGWYVIGQCHLRQTIRTFRLDRILQIDMLEHRFIRSKNFNAMKYLRESIASLPREFSVKIRLLTDIDNAKKHINDTFGLLEQVDGGVVLHNQADDLKWVARTLAALPFEFEIICPSTLKIELKNVAQNLLKIAKL